ncbi:PQQ-dependent sugar dehydrogenase [Wenzhouxiangella marina]|uniref:PQQ-dependent oxidoreductase, gdhB family n=1 Tax=Wenzhouxiangella marina TaxID=1579979 RepID=A0A0K0XWP6_9GAMM|nr:PQQ-dependent sugar dehydrogenase [Wenzhouxiangella marina]AKS42103.1 PQQ-dependent oxidoreductase, gdhB family [Wenzhouxiangella marina]MBB6086127.1 glucose/arabinose dehydrogenase [Wenzhouxiangella marina]
MPAILIFAIALLLALPGPAHAEFELDTVAEGLDHPWSLAFLPEGGYLVTERVGRLRRVSPEGELSEPIEGVPPAWVRSQGGLMGLALDPDYESNGWIYLTLAHGTAEANATRLVRARLDGPRLVDLNVLFTARPTRDTPVHYGGRMAFLPDGTLLLTIGDGFDDREDAQSLESHTGSIVRLHRDGSAPADNPWSGRSDALPELYSIGHRNPQGIVLDPDSGRVWSHEHGPRGGDELNVIEAGVNYGWPVATEGIDYSGARVSPFTSRPGMRDPVLVWTPSIAPSGMVMVHGDRYPDWSGDLLITSLAERSLRRIDLDDGEVVGQERLELPLDERLRDVRVSPGGEIYLLTDSSDGRILRLRRTP